MYGVWCSRARQRKAPLGPSAGNRKEARNAHRTSPCGSAPLATSSYDSKWKLGYPGADRAGALLGKWDCRLGLYYTLCCVLEAGQLPQGGCPQVEWKPRGGNQNCPIPRILERNRVMGSCGIIETCWPSATACSSVGRRILGRAYTLILVRCLSLDEMTCTK
jgi:hypothetical protein